MKMSCGSVLPGVVTLLVFGLSSQAGVAIAAGQSGEPQATLSKAVEIDQQALAQLQAGKYEAAREALWGAIAILNGANRGDDEITAQIHMHLAAVYLTGFNDRKKAIRQFVLALKINPNSTIAPQVETAALDDAFDAARSQFGLGSQVKRASPTASTGETPSDSMIEERATSASGTSDPSVAKVPNATPPIGSADKPNVVPAVDGAAHTTNAAPALLLPDGETSVKSTPAVGDKGPLEEVGRRPPIDEDLPKHHRRLPGDGGLLLDEVGKMQVGVGPARLEARAYLLEHREEAGHGEVAPIGLEDFDEATHVGALEIVGQVGEEVDDSGCVLLSRLAVQEGDGISGALYAHLLDRNIAVVAHRLNIEHANAPPRRPSSRRPPPPPAPARSESPVPNAASNRTQKPRFCRAGTSLESWS